MSLVMRKPAFCICKNKDADQLRGNREADQRLCFRYRDSTIPLLSKSEIPSLLPSSVAVQPGLNRTWSETPKTGFLMKRLILSMRVDKGYDKDLGLCLCWMSELSFLKVWKCKYQLHKIMHIDVMLHCIKAYN